jgi:hypothetical protein
MAKWADYGISKVRYNAGRTHIVRVQVAESLGEKFGTPVEKERADVIAAIENDRTFVTIVKDNDNKWKKGADVGLVMVAGMKYLRTDKNARTTDNLGELPEL